MWRLKGCPRCGGDLNVTTTEHCLQCGYEKGFDERYSTGEQPQTIKSISTRKYDSKYPRW